MYDMLAAYEQRVPTADQVKGSRKLWEFNALFNIYALLIFKCMYAG
jgi:hypothetical protein